MAVVRDFVLFRLNKVTLFFVLPKRTVDSVVPLSPGYESPRHVSRPPTVPLKRTESPSSSSP